MKYRTRDGDMIDAICKLHYGSEARTEAVYDVNPGLANLGPFLPSGIVIDLPEFSVAPSNGTVRIWD